VALKALDFKVLTKAHFYEVMNSSSNKNTEKLSTLVDALPFILEVERSTFFQTGEAKLSLTVEARANISSDSSRLEIDSMSAFKVLHAWAGLGETLYLSPANEGTVTAYLTGATIYCEWPVCINNTQSSLVACSGTSA
jgi:hypothetical protein